QGQMAVMPPPQEAIYLKIKLTTCHILQLLRNAEDAIGAECKRHSFGTDDKVHGDLGRSLTVLHNRIPDSRIQEPLAGLGYDSEACPRLLPDPDFSPLLQFTDRRYLLCISE